MQIFCKLLQIVHVDLIRWVPVPIIVGCNFLDVITCIVGHLNLQVGSVAERVKALFLWRPCDHNRVI